MPPRCPRQEAPHYRASPVCASACSGASSRPVQNTTPLAPSGRTYRYVWLIPGLWLLLASLGSYFKGGENITMAVTWLPGIAIAMPLKFMGSSTSDLALLLLVGLFALAVVGLLLDMAKLPIRAFIVCCLIGLCAGFVLRVSTFIADATQNSFEAAFGRLDFNRWDRVVALTLLVLALGFYIAIVLSFGAGLLRKLGTGQSKLT